MSHLDPNASHSRSNINKALRGGQGYKLVNRLVGNQNYRRKLLRQMGVPLADVEKIRSHIASETHQMGREEKNKKQILQHYRGKWGLSDTDAKQLLQAIAPEATGPTKKEQERTRKRNVSDIRLERLRQENVGSINRLAGDMAKDRAKNVRDKVLRLPGTQNQSGSIASATSLVGGKKSDVTAGSQVEATGVVAQSGKLDVRRSDMKKQFEEQGRIQAGGTGLSGGKPIGGVASIHELRAKKKASEDKTQTEHHDDASRQIPLAA